jgi:hypothetical protein
MSDLTYTRAKYWSLARFTDRKDESETDFSRCLLLRRLGEDRQLRLDGRVLTGRIEPQRARVASSGRCVRGGAITDSGPVKGPGKLQAGPR